MEGRRVHVWSSLPRETGVHWVWHAVYCVQTEMEHPVVVAFPQQYWY